jgi:hypothetical protein
MDVKARDYAEPILKLNSATKKIHESFQKNMPLQAVPAIDDLICELILLKNLAKFQANANKSI